MKTKSIALTFPKLPHPDKKKFINAEVNESLLEAVRDEALEDGVTFRQILEFGLQSYLLNKNPKRAAQLGIVAKGK